MSADAEFEWPKKGARKSEEEGGSPFDREEKFSRDRSLQIGRTRKGNEAGGRCQDKSSERRPR